jgi:endoglycosylceramidase
MARVEGKSAGLMLLLLVAECTSTPAARTCAITAPSPPDWRLTASGTSLTDGLGRVVFLRGVDAGGRSKYSPYMPFDYTDFPSALASYMDRAQSWGIDAMRVPFTWAALEPTQGQDDEDWLSRYDQLLDAAWAHGIWTVIDFHQDVYAECYCGDGFPDWTVQNPPPDAHDCAQWSAEYLNDPSVEAAFDAFWAPGSSVMTEYQAAWDVMIARYKDKPGVLGFEPMNEPGWGTANESTFTATTLTAFYSVMVPRMRAEAPTSLVFVDATGLDGGLITTSLQKPMGDGIVFAPHFYPLNKDPGAAQGALMPWVTMSQSWNVPLFIGEFSANDQSPDAPAFVSAQLSAFDFYGVAGATEWEYSVSSDIWNSETYSVVGADGTEYPVASAMIRPYAQAVAGSSIQQAWDNTSATFTLTYTPTSSITVVSLPKRTYAGGYAVALTGGCYDDTSQPGQLLIQSDAAASTVSLTISPP